MSRPIRLLSTAARLVKRPPWTPPTSLRFALRDIDPATVTPSKWVPPQGADESLPFRVCPSFTRASVLPCFLLCPPPPRRANISTFPVSSAASPTQQPQVFRTTKGKQLPVYTSYHNGRTRCMTIVRRYRGDESELAAEMSRVCDDRPVTVRPGRMEVKGNYCGRVTEWLQRLGF